MDKSDEESEYKNDEDSEYSGEELEYKMRYGRGNDWTEEEQKS